MSLIMRLAVLWREDVSRSEDKAPKHVTYVHLHTEIADMSTFWKRTTAPESQNLDQAKTESYMVMREGK